VTLVPARAALAAVILLLAAGCDRAPQTIVISAPTPTPTPTPTPAPPTPAVIEFRVLGTVSGVTVRYVSTQDGTNVVTTDLPFDVAFSTTAVDSFLSLQASAANCTGFLQVQILVNGVVVRDDNRTGVNPTVQIAFTYVRSS
jgi:hypothetical protein